MPTATFYTTAKRSNSTKQPSGGVAISVLLKDGCDFLAPVFRLEYASTPNWTMASFEGRIYFITGVTSYRNNIWDVAAVVDVLATYKTAIGATSAYVIFANTTNLQIIDPRLPIKTAPIVDYRNANVPHLSTVGTYLLSVVGAANGAGATRGPRTYALSAGALANVLQRMQSYISDLGSADTDTFQAILTIGRQLSGAGSIMENIRGCTWVPWDVPAMGGVTLEKIWLGLFDCSYDSAQTGIEVAGYAVETPVTVETVSVAIPWAFNDWRRNSPYTQVYLYIPFIGLMQLSSENLAAASALDLIIAVNRLTGNINVQVKAGGEFIGTYSGSTGIGIPVGSGGAPSIFAAVGEISRGASMAAGLVNPGAGAVLGAVANASHIAPNTISAGNLSGGAGIGLDLVVSCYTVSHDTSAPPDTLAPAVGVPVNAVHTLSDFAGFIQCQGASISVDATDTEREQINGYLNGGFFYE